MSKSTKFRSLTVAALATTALFAAQPAAADTISLNGFWVGGSNTESSISFNGIDWHTGASATVNDSNVWAGGFNTTNLTTGGAAFQSFCVDIFHSFSFVASSEDTLAPATIINATVATDLGRLYTQHHADIDSTSSSTANEAAFQLAVWEIVNEGATTPGGAYDLSSGAFTALGADVALAQTWLNGLGATGSEYFANIWDVQSGQTGVWGPQDVVVFAAVPEPQTYAMMLVGLGLLGFSARRKNQNQG